MRHTLETKIVKQLRTSHHRTHNLIRARYVREMEKMGYTYLEALRYYEDVYDIAMLEKWAA